MVLGHTIYFETLKGIEHPTSNSQINADTQRCRRLVLVYLSL